MNTNKIVYAGLLIAFGVFLPLLFHTLIPQLELGPKLLPIHYSAYFAAGFFGPLLGGIVGFITPILSFFLTTMPPQITFIYIAFETMTYGIVFGIFYFIKHKNVYFSMVIAMVLGRLVNIAGLYFIGNLLLDHLAKPFQMMNIIGSLTTGLIGNALQLVLIPIIIKRINSVFNFTKNGD